MKKLISMLLAAALMLFLGIPVFADNPLSERESVKSVDPSSTYMKQRDSKAMPSVGSVKLPVILVDFDGYRMDESFLEKCEKYFNAEYDPSLSTESPFAQSVRGAYKKLSYGRLDLTVDVLPIFHSEYSAFHYKTRGEGLALVREILNNYVEKDILQKEDYDSDHDGLVDGVIVKFYLTPEEDSEGNSANQGDAFGDHTSSISSLEGFSRCICTTMFERYSWSDEPLDIWDVDHRNTDSHEIGHMMGLPDHYPTSSYTWLDYQLGDIMTAGCMQYINVYDKLLLGWVDPIILTNDDAVSKQELYAVENYSDCDSSKALVFIPDPVLFPNTEFYMVEYRNASQKAMNPYDDQMYGHPGMVIWHCNAALTASDQYLYDDNYIRPVYKSGKVKDEKNWYQSIYDSSDLYATGDIFSSDTTPNSDFYNDIYTGAYLEVESITPEKAVIKAGFRNPDLSPGPVLHVTGPSKKVTKDEVVTYTVTVTEGENGRVIPYEELNADYYKHITKTTGTIPEYYSLGWEFKNPCTFAFGRYASLPWGDGMVEFALDNAWVTYNGKVSHRMDMEPFYVDSTSPEITLNGENPQYVELGDKYVESGAEASDNLDSIIENNVRLNIDNSKVNTRELGTYSVIYSAKDEAGNKAEAKRTVIVEDTIAPTATVTYSTTKPTNGDVVATLVPSEKVTVTNNDGSLTHTFEANGSFTFEFEDGAGNKGTAIATVTNIDKSLPTGTVSYDITDLTNQDVTASLEVAPGITILNNGGSNTYLFTENGSFEFQIRNAIGTEGVVAASVSWIDKTPPTAKVSYSTAGPTNQDVTATITPSEAVTITSEGGTSHTFTANGSFTFEFVDKVGNAGNATATVDWIDKTPPTATVEYSTTDWTNKDVIATIVPSGKVTMVSNGGESHTFTTNGSFTFEFEDRAGNQGSVTATVRNIDKTPPIIALKGDNPQTIEQGKTYTELGADVTDDLDTGIDKKLKTDASQVDTRKAGEYVVVYTATDHAGNITEAKRKVVVKAKASDPTPPASDPDPDLTPTPSWENSFVDVAEDDWYYSAVRYATENGLFYGTSNTTFSPNDDMTRGMLATVIYRLAKEPGTTVENLFNDVADGKYYTEAIAWAAENKIVAGYGNHHFGPEDSITREQLATILWRYAGSPKSAGSLDDFIDGAKTSDYAIPALQWAVKQKIVSGKGNGILDPRGKATRAEVAAMLMRYCENKESK